VVSSRSIAHTTLTLLRASAIKAWVGIEALVCLTDMGGLSREEAVEVMRSNARTLLRSALERLE
jgi:hypothetical protein